MSIIEKAVGKLEKKAGIKADKVVEKNESEISVQTKPNSQTERTDWDNKEEPDLVKHVVHNTVNKNYININLKRLNLLGIVTPDQGKTQVAEQFRIIKRPLLTNAFAKKNNNLVMVASALQGEGKSFCATNLAMSIASEMDHRVLLVDADVARPSIPAILGFKNKKGLLDILLDDSNDVADVLFKTNIEKLSLITAGTPHPHATELLASQAMAMLLEELAQRYNDRIVIFDSPPMLLTSEARVLAERMGQIVLVVEAERTTQQALKYVLNQLNNNNINLIYNKDRGFASSEYYGYYYS